MRHARRLTVEDHEALIATLVDIRSLPQTTEGER